MKLKKGDKLKEKKSGKITKVLSVNNIGEVKTDKALGCENWSLPHLEKNFILLKNGKEPDVNFILSYYNYSNSIEEFETHTAIKERIKELVKKESSLNRDSIIVYKVSKKMPVTLVDNVIIKGIN